MDNNFIPSAGMPLGLVGYSPVTTNQNLFNGGGRTGFNPNGSILGLSDTSGSTGFRASLNDAWSPGASSQNLFGDFGLSDLGGLSGMLGTGAQLMQGIGALGSLGLGKKAYNLAKKQFGFQKGLANRNLLNQATTINNIYDNAAQVAAGMIGGKDAEGNYGMTDQAIVDKYAAKAKEKHVDGSPI